MGSEKHAILRLRPWNHNNLESQTYTGVFKLGSVHIRDVFLQEKKINSFPVWLCAGTTPVSVIAAALASLAM
jgi:hypothetical protein